MENIYFGKIKNYWKWLVRAYIVIITIAFISYSPFITLGEDGDNTSVTFKIFDYEKSILILNQ